MWLFVMAIPQATKVWRPLDPYTPLAQQEESSEVSDEEIEEAGNDWQLDR